MSKPNTPTADEILSALHTLQRADRDAWLAAVSEMDGIDDRLGEVYALGDALAEFAHVVMLDADALAYGHKKDADHYGDNPTAADHRISALGHEIMARQASAYAGAVEEAADRVRDLERELEEVNNLDDLTDEDMEARIAAL